MFAKKIVPNAVISAVLFCCVFANANSFPTKPIRIISPSPAGGTVDMQARIIANDLTASLGQPVVIDTKAGASGTLAITEMLNSPHDGHTIVVHIDAIFTEVPHTIKTRYDIQKDVTPLVETATTGLFFLVPKNSSANNLAEFVSQGKSSSKPLSFASYGNGTASHILGITLNQTAKLSLQHIPYKGAVPAATDVAGGVVQIGIVGETASKPFIDGDRARALAISSPRRSPLFPSVPTVAESGFPQLEYDVRVLFVAPSDIPSDAKVKLRNAIIGALDKQSVRDQMVQAGLVPVTINKSSEELSTMLMESQKRFGDILKSIDYIPE